MPHEPVRTSASVSRRAALGVGAVAAALGVSGLHPVAAQDASQ